MVIGIGTDIIEIKRVEKAISSKSFLNRYYTRAEIALIQKKGPSTAAGNFAAKEALAKALGTGFCGFSPIDIEILRDEKDAPYALFHKEAKKIADSLGVQYIKISISHSKENAVAFALLGGN